MPRTTSGKLEDPDLKLMFENVGFSNVIAMDEMETIRFSDAVLTGLPFIGEHSDLNILTKMCYLVQIGEFRLLFLADSRIVEAALYKHIHRQIGDVDVMFLGMECDGAPLTWLYGPVAFCFALMALRYLQVQVRGPWQIEAERETHVG